MLTFKQHGVVSEAISKGLDRAEVAWLKVGNKFIKKAMAMDMIRVDEQIAPSIIPGHPWVTDGTPRVDEFIALVVDMRNSSDHLKTKLSSPKIEHGFQRIFYETSALLPAVSVVTSFEEGVVTEYLGDGALALFQIDKNDKEESIRRANRAAKHCIGEMRMLINTELDKRYKLPPINLGVGLALSNALVTLVGSADNLQPKAIGECVWQASKLSGGVNTILVSENMRMLWPQSKGGKLQFVKANMKGVDGYRISQGE